jgi:hypothetical protein
MTSTTKQIAQMKKNLFFLFIVTFSSQLIPQQNNLTNERASKFIEAIITGSDSLENFVLPEELAISKRLGIQYEGVKNKFLISYEIPAQIIKEIKNRQINYNIAIQNIDDEYSILNFVVSSKNYKTKFYFKNEYLISPPYFYFNDWQRIESEHFIFYVSEPVFFNQYSIDMLEKFIVEMFSVMNYTREEMQHLKGNKIVYILCKDEDEIELLTGYKARGLCNLAYDYLITTYNCHYHELVHLLMNFKLKELPLYTHPFFQEGLAVALGGRGGKEPDVILSLGQFLAESGFLDYKELLNENDYKNFDASMSYPLSGLYNKFLLETNTLDEYINLYTKYSGLNISGIEISPNDLKNENEWNEFLRKDSFNSVKIDFDEKGFNTLTENSNCIIKEGDEEYLFESKGNLLISTPDKQEKYFSKIFRDSYFDKEYQGEKYLINVNDSEISVYNLYTDNLIANYVSGFTTEMKTVPKENGFYKFIIKKNIFDELPDKLIIN